MTNSHSQFKISRDLERSACYIRDLFTTNLILVNKTFLLAWFVDLYSRKKTETKEETITEDRKQESEELCKHK